MTERQRKNRLTDADKRRLREAMVRRRRELGIDIDGRKRRGGPVHISVVLAELRQRWGLE
ncbi:MAG: hypothetical protein IID45_09120 [Planctomycetes bacterium]|nr:hypothetical protein [Planctomycetota bacterium]